MLPPVLGGLTPDDVGFRGYGYLNEFQRARPLSRGLGGLMAAGVRLLVGRMPDGNVGIEWYGDLPWFQRRQIAGLMLRRGWRPALRITGRRRRARAVSKPSR